MKKRIGRKVFGKAVGEIENKVFWEVWVKVNRNVWNKVSGKIYWKVWYKVYNISLKRIHSDLRGSIWFKIYWKINRKCNRVGDKISKLKQRYF